MHMIRDSENAGGNLDGNLQGALNGCDNSSWRSVGRSVRGLLPYCRLSDIGLIR